MTPKRKICFVITSQIHYARSRWILKELRKHPGIELQVVVAASAILPQYGDVLAAMAADGCKADTEIVMTLSGGNPVAMAKTTGIGIMEFATAFNNLSPDIVCVRGDRYEVLSAAVAAAYMNIPVAHIEGGDVTGTIDESVRHAITKLCHIHFTTNEQSRRNVVQMGENAEHVFNVGCPELEELDRHSTIIDLDEINRQGVGDPIPQDAKFLVVMYHPVTTEPDNREKVAMLLETIHGLNIPAVWFWPNVDAGTDDVAKAIRVFRENERPRKMHFIKYFLPDKFIALLRQSACLVGNSSAGIKEASYLGVPAVNIGSRQTGRLRGPNVLDVNHDPAAIRAAIEKQLAHGPYERCTMYYKPHCAKTITDILATITVSPQKHFYSQPDV